MVNSAAEKQPPFSQVERLQVRPLTLAATSGNIQLPPLPVGLWLQSTIVNGYPDWSVVVPVHCQPPRTPRTKEFWWLSFGSSQIPWALNALAISKLAGPGCALRLYGS